MTIDGNTNVAKLLDEHPELLDIFVKVSPHFRKLENKFLRKTIARRVRISDAAKLGGVDVDHLVEALNAEVGSSPAQQTHVSNYESDVDWSGQYAEEFEYTDSEIQFTLDVREDIASNRDPLAGIMRTAKSIEAGRILAVINSFEPIPLYEVLGRKGFVHRTEQQGEDFRVLFKKTNETDETRSVPEAGRANDTDGDEKVIELDVRGLEPPEPMMRILKTLNTIGGNTMLLVHHHREPMFLYPKLEERGFEAVTNRVEENHYKIVIKRKEPK